MLIVLVAVAGVMALAETTGTTVAAVVAQQRAATAADAAAHDAEVTLINLDHRDDLSIAVQAGRTSCAQESAQTDAPASPDDDHCRPVVDAARRAAAANGAVLRLIEVSPDLVDRWSTPRPGRLLVMVRVSVHRDLPIGSILCARGRPPDDSPCWATATAAAQEV